jgi:DNA-binding response OmpR family regulator
MLIADGSEPFATSVAKTFQEEFVLDICYDGETALKKLVSTMPDVLIINLMLPYKDGLTVLQQTAFRPRIILAVSPYINNYIAKVAADLGVQCLLIMPTVQTLHMRIMDLVASVLEQQSDVQSQIVFHLQ